MQRKDCSYEIDMLEKWECFAESQNREMQL